MDFEHKISSLIEEVTSIVKKKNKDYGGSFQKSIDKDGPMMYSLKLEDKVLRLRGLWKSTGGIDVKALRDTAFDIVGYAYLILDDMDRRRKVDDVCIDKKFAMISELLKKTMCEKYDKYGESFKESVDKYGMLVYSARLEDKQSRVYNILKTEKTALESESLWETVFDMAGYGILIMRDLDNRYN